MAFGVGKALARCLRTEERSIVVIIVGDGTLGEGLLYESLNLAAIWSLQVLFVVENNGIAQTTSADWTVAGSISAHGAAFGIRAWQLDDAQPDFFESVEDVVREVRQSRSPDFLTIETRRLGSHSKGDDMRYGLTLEQEDITLDNLGIIGRMVDFAIARRVA